MLHTLEKVAAGEWVSGEKLGLPGCRGGVRVESGGRRGGELGGGACVALRPHGVGIGGRGWPPQPPRPDPFWGRGGGGYGENAGGRAPLASTRPSVDLLRLPAGRREFRVGEGPQEP